MSVENGAKYTTLKTFGIVLGLLATISIASYSIVFNIAQDGVNRARDNEVIIARLDQRMDSMEKTLENILREIQIISKKIK